MPIDNAYDGEDVPITATYTSGGAGVDADVAPSITITENSTGTDVVAGAAMSSVGGTGEYEYVWDSAVDGNGPGLYEIEVTGEFGGETKIVRDTIELL